jgi:SAM-dependent methyltransferase
MKAIENTYTGEYARNYNSSRTHSIEWIRENNAIEPMLRMIGQSQTVLDIAAGTGRWLHIYAEIGARPTLLDASRDMLDQAQRKAHELGLQISVLSRGALESTPFPHAEWIVVTRFFNWIPLAHVENVLARCIENGSKNFLFMLTYLPNSTSWTKALKTRYAYLRKNAASVIGLREKGVYHLHRETDVRQMLHRLNLALKIERVIVETGGRRNVMLYASQESDHTTPAVTVVDNCHLSGEECVVNGQRCAVRRGSWAFYVPSLGLKLLHAVAGNTHCVHHSAPNREAVLSGEALPVSDDRYTIGDCANAFSKTAVRRAVENYAVTQRLHKAGLGPEALGVCVVRQFTADYSNVPCQTAGIFVKDANGYPPKEKTTVEQIVECGVVPDRLLSCVRQQINGYVIDLNSVVGAIPSEANDVTAEIEAHVNWTIRTTG